MAVYIPNYTKADMEELFKWARHGRNNAMIGVNAEIIEIPSHGSLIDGDALWGEINKICDRRDAGIITDLTCLQQLLSAVRHAPTIIPAEEVKK